ncbi:MAG: pyruvate ferredoxin oxidoreductase [Elusimicrobia bacterium]|nr:pyruvate ferredoxin oxidoreductase [Elusimicrobiota bacterium]
MMSKQKITALAGTGAASEAMRQINPDVVAAYPITPQTEIVMKFSEFVGDGKVDTEMIPVESEHSAMSACVGASAAGARTMTATSANGLALMWEIVYIAASQRLPIVMPVVNRALSGPINIHCDHSDTMGTRESGWIQIYCENGQEVYDNVICAIRIAENKKVLLPVMVMQDGFITSHALERVSINEDADVRKFVGEYKPEFPLLDIDKPVTYGPLDLFDYYFEHKRQQSDALTRVPKVIDEVYAEYKKLSGREYRRIETYKADGAELAVIALNSTVGTAKDVVDELREKGVKAGVVFPRMIRPFPGEELGEILSKFKAVAVLDRSESFSSQGGPLFCEVKAALYETNPRPLMMNGIYGLGGREINPEQIMGVFDDLGKAAKAGKIAEKVKYIGVRD